MTTLSCALALLSGVIGAGFASGREIAHFFASHGPAAPLAALAACLTLPALFCRLPAQLERAGETTLTGLCRARFGARFGRLCAALFFLLSAVTGGAMLSACGELFALTLPVRGAYPMGLAASLLLGAALASRGLSGLALPGAVLVGLLPLLFGRMLALPAGEACFSSAGEMLRAGASGVTYGALNAAMLTGTLPLLLPLSKKQRRGAAALFAALFAVILALGVAVLQKHRQAAISQSLPFVALSGELGQSGYFLCALAMYAAALSTLCAMLAALMQMLPRRAARGPIAALCCLGFALLGFGRLVTQGYPMLGALCAGLMALLCCPGYQASSSSR